MKIIKGFSSSTFECLWSVFECGVSFYKMLQVNDLFMLLVNLTVKLTLRTQKKKIMRKLFVTNWQNFFFPRPPSGESGTGNKALLCG